MQGVAPGGTVKGRSAERTRAPRCPGSVARWTARLLALVALGVTAYLAWVSLHYGDARLGCGVLPQFDCEHVITSRWSSWLGVPVSLAASGVYALIFAATVLIGPRTSPAVRRVAWCVLLVSTTAAAAAALWFLGLLTFVLESLCIYCMIVHACGLTIAALLLTRVPVRFRKSRPKVARVAALGVAPASGPAKDDRLPAPVALRPAQLWLFPSLGLAGVAVLIAGQVLFPPKRYQVESLANLVAPEAAAAHGDVPAGGSRDREAEENGSGRVEPAAAENSQHAAAPLAPSSLLPLSAGAERKLPQPPRIVNGRIVLDPRQHPVLDDPKAASYVVVKLIDYACEHCRTLDHYMQQARTRYGQQLAIVNLPVPLNTNCNEFVTFTHPDHQCSCHYARQAVAVWRLAPEKFEQFHRWMFAPNTPPLIAEANDYAAELVGRKEFDAERRSPEVKQTIEAYNDLFRQCGAGSLPIMLLEGHIIRGEASSAQEIFDLLEKLSGIKPLPQ